MRRLGFFLALAIAGCGDDDATTDASADGGPDAPRTDARRDGMGDDDAMPGDARPDGDRPDGRPDADGGPPPVCTLEVPSLQLTEIAADFDWVDPIFLAQAPGNDDTLWVGDQSGKVYLVRDGAVLPTPFLDLSSVPLFAYEDGGGEAGLLGFAFHPEYATNGRFFVYYTTYETDAEVDYRDIVAEYVVSSNPDVADPSEVVRLRDDYDPESNHNGGGLAFGPDGYLYAGAGDGGNADDVHPADFEPTRHGSGQNLALTFGKMLRFDVDASASGFAAATNPFAMDGDDATNALIWAYGLRNPWRFSFDRVTGDLWIGDVGQNQWEEIDFQPAASTGGENYGWRRYEGTHEFDARGEPDDEDDVAITQVPPIMEFVHTSDETLRGACSITGGYVYRGTEIAALDGTYLFGDYCSRDIVAARRCSDGTVMSQRVDDLSRVVNGLASFGEDNAGNVYVVDLGAYPGIGRPIEGAIYRIDAAD